jgi:hypothetical protein
LQVRQGIDVGCCVGGDCVMCSGQMWARLGCARPSGLLLSSRLCSGAFSPSWKFDICPGLLAYHR